MSFVWLECLGGVVVKNYNKPPMQTKQPHIKEEDECMADFWYLYLVLYYLLTNNSKVPL